MAIRSILGDMDPETLLAELDEMGIVDDDGKWVALEPSFEETFETYRRLVERVSIDDLASQTADLFDDLPSPEELRAVMDEYDDELIACYLAIRAESTLDDQTAMAGAELIMEFLDLSDQAS